MMPSVAERVMDFSNVKKGSRARIKAIKLCSPHLKRLMEMGLTVGTEFIVTKVAPFGDPIEISLRGYHLCLRKNETRDIEIEFIVQP
jgi:Fe2+ transport system protein FeoA